MKNIISFSARKQSGKSTCCSVLENNGYTVINFADELKLLCCSILGISLEVLNDNKESPRDIVLNSNDYLYISRETTIPLENVVDIFATKTLKTIRELLQVLGTDLIRKYNKNWHINRIREKIKPGEKYAISDARFKNEKEFVDSIGGECWFIIKPDNQNISNHISETDLKWNDFVNIYVNESTKESMENIWNIYYKFGWKPLNKYSTSDIMLEPTIKNVCDYHKYKNTSHPYIVENLKHWQCTFSKNIPDIIYGHKDLEAIWSSSQENK